MKRQLLALSRHYQAALQKHLLQLPKSGGEPARRLGQQAVMLGLETLDLAHIHKMALIEVTRPGGPAAATNRVVKRSGQFFSEVIAPIEQTHLAGREAAAHLHSKNKALKQRTAQLVAANRHLRQGILRRKAAEDALTTREHHYAKLLQESRLLHKHLQRLTRQILSAQEMERTKISRELQDEIAQTLLGINVRLLTLKKGAASPSEGLAKEIASTQRLVEKSVKTINLFARKFGTQHEA